MKRKPLKISWKSWCLYKLAIRDYSSNEMSQMITKRAAESDQEVDPGPVINELMEDGAINDKRYLKNQLAMATNGRQIKGPREIKRKLVNKGGLNESLINKYFNEDDQIWFELAGKIKDQTLAANGYGDTEKSGIPFKLYNSLKQKLYRKGFTRAQIDYALENLVPEFEQKKQDGSIDIQRQIEKLCNSGKGPKAILYELKHKGASETEIQTALDNLDMDWISLAQQQLRKKFKYSKKLTMKERKKQFDFLARRGFTTDQIRTCMNES